MSRLCHSTFAASVAAICLLLGGCHSAFVQATLLNRTGQPIQLFEVDYPSASFGGNELQDGAAFHYRFKILGSGPVKLAWTDSLEHDHNASGPELREGQEGVLTMTIGSTGVIWAKDLHSR